MKLKTTLAFRQKSTIVGALLAATLAGCGGGGGDPAPVADATPVIDATPIPVRVFPADGASDLNVACVNCSADSPTRYAGAGVGVWSKKNDGTSPVDMSVAIGGLSNNNVTVVLTNETAVDVTLPAIAMSSVLPSPRVAAAQMAPPEQSPESSVEAFNRRGWKTHVAPIATTAIPALPAMKVAMAVQAPILPKVSSTKTFKHHDGTARGTTLMKQIIRADGAVIQVWVESSEVGASKVSTALLDDTAATFVAAGGTYDMLKDIGGPLWGAHGIAELVPGASQVFDVVLLNFVKDSKPFGELGYFYALNTFKKTVIPASNESLSVYLDTETLYLGGDAGQQAVKMTLAHEGMHLGNFYRRAVKLGIDYQFDTWLDEMTAMMAEDALGNAVDPTHNVIRDVRYPDYLRSQSYNCPLLVFTGFGRTCESYSVSGSFGGYLLRQMGLPFFKALLTQPVEGSEAAMQAAIRSVRPASSLGQELRAFSVAAIAGIPAAKAPAGYGFPARTDAAASEAAKPYVLPLIDSRALIANRALPATAPTTLSAYASFPVVHNAIYGNFVSTIRVPAGTTLSVVVSD